MFTAPENLLAAGQANIDNAKRFAVVALEGAERLVDLQVKTAKQAIVEGTKNAKLVMGVKDLQDLAALRNLVAEPAAEKVLAYYRSVYEVMTQTQGEVSKLVEEVVSDFNKTVVAAMDEAMKAAPAGSDMAMAAIKSAMAAANDAYDTMTKAARQVQEITEANVTAATTVVKPVVPARKKAA